jgi:hypothetical protein
MLNAARLAPWTRTVCCCTFVDNVYSPGGSSVPPFTVKLNGTWALIWPAWLGEATAVNSAMRAPAHMVLKIRFVMIKPPAAE